MREVQGERPAAEAELGRCVPGEPMTKDQVPKLVGAMQDLTKVLEEADPKLKAEVYAELGNFGEIRPGTAHRPRRGAAQGLV